MWKPLVFISLFLPMLAQGKEFTLPSGLIINIPDSELVFYEKEFREFTLPSGLKWWAEAIVNIPKAQAATLDFGDQIKLYITRMALNYEISSDYMIRLANCESGMNPEAFNPNDPAGGAHGLYQFLKPTWRAWQKESGIKGNIYDWRAQAKMASWGISKGRQKAWFNCNYFIKNNHWPK